jgi:hypothetical protein
MGTALRIIGWFIVAVLAGLCLALGLHYSGFWHRDGHQGGPTS